ncbi:MAG TPA: ThuA domain-containing protein [Fimbriimonadaceae bacterium]|nr:ThuA domain-containing protein [Fimbriimonadaceae bacterium]
MVLASILGLALTQQALVVSAPNVLVFSKTAGFRHDSIEHGRDVLKNLASKQGWTIQTTEDAAVFTDVGLAKVDVVVFLCTTGDVLNPAQQDAVQRWFKNGKGFVGIHSAADTEYDWSWYGNVVGGYFKSHPQIQKATLKVEDIAHPTSAHLPLQFERTDEWYDFRENPRANVRVLCSLDTKSYKGSVMDDHPINWCKEIDGGRAFYTGFGHTKESYDEPLVQEMLVEAILWSAQGKRPSEATTPEWRSSQGWIDKDGGIFNQGNAVHLVSKADYGDQQVHAEFMIPKGSNSGVYLQGRYEVQILDSYGKALSDMQFSDCGGIYQRFDEAKGTGWEGTKPLKNAIREPGQWNTYDILFRAPRFDRSGKKVENARFLEVRLNGVVVQKNVEATGPTRGPMFQDEKATGPLYLQGDHGPITYRNVWVKKATL